jgi:hypothetical protein
MAMDTDRKINLLDQAISSKNVARLRNMSYKIKDSKV